MAAHLQQYQFKPGQSGNPAGKPKGVRNQFADSFIQAFAKDFAEHGEEAIELVRHEKPAEYLKVAVRIANKTQADDASDESAERILATLNSGELAAIAKACELLIAATNGEQGIIEAEAIQ